MDKSNTSLGLEEDSGQTLTPSYLDEKGKVFTFTDVGSEKDLASFLKNQISDPASKKESLDGQTLSTPEESNDNASFSMKKCNKTQPQDSLSQDDKGIEVANESDLIVSNRGDAFEKLIFVKARVVKKETAAPKPKVISSIKKSFWIYPITKTEFSSEEKEEADLLTTFGLSPSTPKLSQKQLDETIPYITEYFANYNVNSTSMYSFVLNKNEKQTSFVNPFNLTGLRYFYGCLVSDFELVKYLDKDQSVRYKLEPSQSLILIESKYPFITFFNAVLGHIFNIVRVKRLEIFAKNYNGNERDLSNIQSIRHYDSSSILSVIVFDEDS